MGRQVVDEDGTIYERDRDGDMVPVGHIEPAPMLAGVLCEEHGEYGYEGIACPCCISETLAGERPRAFIGHKFESDQ